VNAVLLPVEVPITFCPAIAKTASPSESDDPLILTIAWNSSPAPSAHEPTDICFTADTPAGTLNELETLAPARLLNAWKLVVVANAPLDLLTTIAIFFPMHGV
jgi:hypothetical protein